MIKFKFFVFISSCLFASGAELGHTASNSTSTSEARNLAELSNGTFRAIFATSCPEDRACVRFCCDRNSSCDDPQSFDVSSRPEARKLSTDYVVVTGKTCEIMYEGEPIWEFEEVGF